MRIVRVVVLVGLVVKSVLLGTLLWGPIAQAGGESHAAAEPAPEKGGKKAGVAAPLAPELLAHARGFRTLVEGVASRKADLEAREKALALREDTLHALETTVGEQVARLEGALKAAGVKGGAHLAAGGTGGAGGGANPAPSGGLTKIYESMKPEEAAPILEKMDDGIVKDILAPMKERQIGAILAVMNRDRAVAVTKLLAAGGHTAQTADRR